jgi:hypothetical protein
MSACMDLLESGAAAVSAVPAIVPSVINLSNALAPVEQHSEGCVWHMLMVAFIPFLPEATALQVLVSVHACLEAAGATLGQPIVLAAKCAQGRPMPGAQANGNDALHAKASLEPVIQARHYFTMTNMLGVVHFVSVVIGSASVFIAGTMFAQGEAMQVKQILSESRWADLLAACCSSFFTANSVHTQEVHTVSRVMRLVDELEDVATSSGFVRAAWIRRTMQQDWWQHWPHSR